MSTKEILAKPVIGLAQTDAEIIATLTGENEIQAQTITELSEKLTLSESAKDSGGGKSIIKIGKKEYVALMPALRYGEKIVKIEDHTEEQLKKLLDLGTIFQK
jgi:hypothetical protein